jgi:acyl-coenzyme A synthetase/AMP-(fatty) acid ligase
MRLDNWIRTHDLAVRDADGYYWYRGRNDDLIKSSGYRIGPAEIEDVLIAHPAVAEAAVIGRPGPRARSDRQGFRSIGQWLADPSMISVANCKTT